MHYHPDLKQMLEVKKIASRRMFEFGIDHSDRIVNIGKENKGKVAEGGFNYFPRQESKIGIYRRPGSKMLEVFVPLFVISIFVFAILASADTFEDYADRCANLSVALLAYIAFMPSYREIMPPTPYVTVGDAVIYLNLLGTLVAQLESYLVSRENFGFDEETKDNISWGLEVACFVLLIGPFIFILYLYLKFRLVSLPKYNKT